MWFSIGFALIALSASLLVGTLAMVYQAKALNLEKSNDKRQLAREIKTVVRCMRICAAVVTVLALSLIVMHYLLPTPTG